MQKYIIPVTGLLIGLSLIIGGFVANKIPVKKQIIKENTDNRGLTSVLFVEGADTLGYDYLTRAEYDSIFKSSKK